MIRYSLTILIALLALAMQTMSQGRVGEAFGMPSHPRLLLQSSDEGRLHDFVREDSLWSQTGKAVIAQADRYAAERSPESYRLQGKRLLGVSRKVLKKLLFLGYAYRMTGDGRYSAAAVEEMLNACSFPDWHPSHFLDTAELTLAVALCHDWLYGVLSPEQRAVVSRAIVEKGLKPSLDARYNWFVSSNINWNQVCHAGMLYGALSVWEDAPRLCSGIVNRAIECLPLAMEMYDPDGAYPEGCGYWAYGTVYNVLAIDALEMVFGSDFALMSNAGFARTGEYITQVCTPSMHTFSYGDNGTEAGISPALFWFLSRREAGVGEAAIRSFLSRAFQRYDGHGEAGRARGAVFLDKLVGDRMAPLALVWGCKASPHAHAGGIQPLAWYGGGCNPVFVTRSGWEEGCAYLGMKAGSPSVNHGQMDVGEFVYESHGVRWAVDLGSETYNNLEQAGMDIWDMSQGSDRWKVYRYSHQSHNVMMFDGKPQVARGSSSFTDKVVAFPGYAVADLTPVYEGQVKKALRRCELLAVDDVVICDEVECLDAPTEYSWTLMTEAGAVPDGDGGILLSKDGHSLHLSPPGGIRGRWTIEAAVPAHSFERSNPGCLRVRFTTRLDPGTRHLLEFRLHEGGIVGE